MALSDSLLAQLRDTEARVATGKATPFDARQLLDSYVRAVASERGITLPATLPDESPYTLVLGRFAAGGTTAAAVEDARELYLTKTLAAGVQPPTLNRAAIVKQRLDAAIAAKAPQATIDALKAEYAKYLGQQTTAAQTALNNAVASGAPTSAVAALQTRLDAAKNQEASGKLATSPMKEILTFAVLTSPAWLPLLMMKYKVI